MIAVSAWPLRAGVAVIGSHLLRRSRARVTGATPVPRHLRRIVDAFHTGYLAACRVKSVEAIPAGVSDVDPDMRGFAHEGAAMAVSLVDGLSPGGGERFTRLVSLADAFVYLLYVGRGWALARRADVEGTRFHELDPLLRWLALDGVGFHDGFTRGTRPAARRPRRLSEYGARAFDQGLGRSLWFSTMARPAAIASEIRAAATTRHGDLWSGVGLACAYAGGVDAAAIEEIAARAHPFHAHLAQGVAFASAAHHRASGRCPAYTAMASRLICGMEPQEAAALTQHAVIDVADTPQQPAYEQWRARIRRRFTS